MEKITNKEIIDVVKFSDDKLIFVQRNPMSDPTQFKADYYIINFSTGVREVVTKKAYLLKKFGAAHEKICETISDFIKCQAMILKDKSVLVVFPNGQIGLFDGEGNLMWNKELSYNNSPVFSLAEDEDAFWCVCKDENSVMRYSTDNFTVDIRIGSKEAQTFAQPIFLSADEKYVYVCCGNRVRRIDKQSLIVDDINDYYPNLNRFYRFKDVSIICCSDGLYFDN
ncbi:MAG: hypothetical protein IJR70_02590 [Eubacterium sp.]|nr:hypothetical protein [Eubacterium sp.]